jgi:hypothetical protein
MHTLVVELLKTKSTAYHFSGKEDECKEFSNLWGCDYFKDPLHPYLYFMVLPDGTRLYTGNYVVVEAGTFTIYSYPDFFAKYRVVYDSKDRDYLNDLMG